MEVGRLPHEAELALSNGHAELSEACTVLRQFMSAGRERDLWNHQIKKLRMALGIVNNVRELVEHDDRFAALRPLRERSK